MKRLLFIPCLPSDNILHKISLVKKGGTFALDTDPFAGKVKLKVRSYSK
jgi:hypothetical protein